MTYVFQVDTGGTLLTNIEDGSGQFGASSRQEPGGTQKYFLIRRSIATASPSGRASSPE